MSALAHAASGTPAASSSSSSNWGQGPLTPSLHNSARLRNDKSKAAAHIRRYQVLQRMRPGTSFTTDGRTVPWTFNGEANWPVQIALQACSVCVGLQVHKQSSEQVISCVLLLGSGRAASERCFTCRTQTGICNAVWPKATASVARATQAAAADAARAEGSSTAAAANPGATRGSSVAAAESMRESSAAATTSMVAEAATTAVASHNTPDIDADRLEVVRAVYEKMFDLIECLRIADAPEPYVRLIQDFRQMYKMLIARERRNGRGGEDLNVKTLFSRLRPLRLELNSFEEGPEAGTSNDGTTLAQSTLQLRQQSMRSHVPRESSSFALRLQHVTPANRLEPQAASTDGQRTSGVQPQARVATIAQTCSTVHHAPHVVLATSTERIRAYDQNGSDLLIDEASRRVRDASAGSSSLASSEHVVQTVQIPATATRTTASTQTIEALQRQPSRAVGTQTTPTPRNARSSVSPATASASMHQTPSVSSVQSTASPRPLPPQPLTQKNCSKGSSAQAIASPRPAQSQQTAQTRAYPSLTQSPPATRPLDLAATQPISKRTPAQSTDEARAKVMAILRRNSAQVKAALVQHSHTPEDLVDRAVLTTLGCKTGDGGSQTVAEQAVPVTYPSASASQHIVPPQQVSQNKSAHPPKSSGTPQRQPPVQAVSVSAMVSSVQTMASLQPAQSLASIRPANPPVVASLQVSTPPSTPVPALSPAITAREEAAAWPPAMSPQEISPPPLSPQALSRRATSSPLTTPPTPEHQSRVSRHSASSSVDQLASSDAEPTSFAGANVVVASGITEGQADEQATDTPDRQGSQSKARKSQSAAKTTEPEMSERAKHLLAALPPPKKRKARASTPLPGSVRTNTSLEMEEVAGEKDGRRTAKPIAAMQTPATRKSERRSSTIASERLKGTATEQPSNEDADTPTRTPNESPSRLGVQQRTNPTPKARQASLQKPSYKIRTPSVTSPMRWGYRAVPLESLSYTPTLPAGGAKAVATSSRVQAMPVEKLSEGHASLQRRSASSSGVVRRRTSDAEGEKGEHKRARLAESRESVVHSAWRNGKKRRVIEGSDDEEEERQRTHNQSTRQHDEANEFFETLMMGLEQDMQGWKRTKESRRKLADTVVRKKATAVRNTHRHPTAIHDDLADDDEDY